MRIRSEHVKHMQGAIEKIATKEKQQSYVELGLAPMRFRWDCLYQAQLSKWICDNLYTYCDDDHIDTALRAIMRELKLEWAANK